MIPIFKDPPRAARHLDMVLVTVQNMLFFNKSGWRKVYLGCITAAENNQPVEFASRIDGALMPAEGA